MAFTGETLGHDAMQKCFKPKTRNEVAGEITKRLFR
jgi:hypothetical protein